MKTRAGVTLLVMMVLVGLALMGGCAAGSGASTQAGAEQAGPISESVERSALFQRAVEELLDAANHENPYIRSNVIEAMQPVPQRERPLIQRGLSDDAEVVRFTAVVSAALLKMQGLRPGIEPLLDDPSPSVQAAARVALHFMGEQVDLTPLAEKLASRKPGVRANVAMLLGMLGDASAVPMLRAAAEEPMPRAGAQEAAVVRAQIAEAVVQLGEDSDLAVLRGGAYNQFGEVRVLSINAMGEVGDRRMIPALRAFLREREPAEVQLAAAAALARLGEADVSRNLARVGATQSRPVVRAQAAWALGWFNDDQTLTSLRDLLDDPVLQVRVAAAGAIVRRLAG